MVVWILLLFQLFFLFAYCFTLLAFLACQSFASHCCFLFGRSLSLWLLLVFVLHFLLSLLSCLQVVLTCFASLLLFLFPLFAYLLVYFLLLLFCAKCSFLLLLLLLFFIVSLFSFHIAFFWLLLISLFFAVCEVCDNNRSNNNTNNTTTTKEEKNPLSRTLGIFGKKNAVKIGVSVSFGRRRCVIRKDMKKSTSKSWPSIFWPKQKHVRKKGLKALQNNGCQAHFLGFFFSGGFAPEGFFWKGMVGKNRGPLIWMRCARLWVFGVFWGVCFLGMECLTLPETL